MGFGNGVPNGLPSASRRWVEGFEFGGFRIRVWGEGCRVWDPGFGVGLLSSPGGWFRGVQTLWRLCRLQPGGIPNEENIQVASLDGVAWRKEEREREKGNRLRALEHGREGGSRVVTCCLRPATCCRREPPSNRLQQVTSCLSPASLSRLAEGIQQLLSGPEIFGD